MQTEKFEILQIMSEVKQIDGKNLTEQFGIPNYDNTRRYVRELARDGYLRTDKPKDLVTATVSITEKGEDYFASEKAKQQYYRYCNQYILNHTDPSKDLLLVREHQPEKILAKTKALIFKCLPDILIKLLFALLDYFL